MNFNFEAAEEMKLSEIRELLCGLDENERRFATLEKYYNARTTRANRYKSQFGFLE